jgi:DNA end-binding protein Ku
VRAAGDVMAMHTMRFADELVDPGDLDLPRVQRKPAKREIDMATALVEGLHTEFKPARYKDTYRADVLDVIERKVAGKEIEPPDEPQEEPSDDPMAALEASLDGKGKRKRGRRPAGRRKKARA